MNNQPKPVTTVTTAAPPLPARLVLADGSQFAGRSFGAPGEVRGEVVFHTGLVGYVQALTDPSYRGQILALTSPLQGNYGVPEAGSASGFESERIQVAGLVVANYTEHPSHHASVQSLGSWLAQGSVPALCGVDTRALTQRLRSHGTLLGALLTAGSDVDAAAGLLRAPGVDMAHVAEAVQPTAPREYPGSGPRILLIDTGAKESIATALHRRGAHVIRIAARSSWEVQLPQIDGVVLGNGPGDPKDLPELVERIRALFAFRGGGLPLFGICLGHQLLARAAGAQTYKLPFGHRSHNQPVLDLLSRRAYVTSQNHGYAVQDATLPPEFSPWFVSLNDGTNEGMRHRYRPILSVQFHPEAAAGPRDTAFLFDEFLQMVNQLKRSQAVPR